MLMAAIMVADELFDARADIDELLEGSSEDAQSVSDRRHAAAG
jgi:cell division protein ZapA